MSVLFYPESIRILGSDTNGNNVMLCEMAVDDIANLPSANAFVNDGYVLSMGCTAIAINDNSKHRLNGGGNWVQIAAGTSTYTRAEIDTMISTINADIDALADEISDHTTFHVLLNTMPYTTLASYADSLGIGEHFIFVQNNNILTDVPFNNSNAIVVVRSYSGNTAAMEFTPMSTTYQMYRYTKIKTAGVWREWYRFTGDALIT